MSEENKDKGSAHEGFERIEPARINPGARSESQPVRISNNGLPVAWVWAALALFLLLGAGVFFWLPQQSAQPVAAGQPQSAPSSEPTQRAESPPPPADAETSLAQREQAQTLAQELTEKRERLAAKNAQRWASEAYKQTATLAETGSTQFEKRAYADAIKSYSKGITQSDALLTKAEQELAAALTRGEQAIANKDSAAAVDAYDLALAIEPENAAAKKGLARAQSLDSVLEKMRVGETQEQDNDLTAARTSYQAALKLDGDYKPAQESLARVQSELSTRAFSQQMSRGLSALDRGDFSAAQAAFLSARKIRPNDSSARDGLTQANAGLEQQAIGRHQKAAEAAAGQENWQQALNEYQAALALDSTLSFAQTGKERAAKRLQLAQKLQFHLDNPQRLSDGAAQTSAETALKQARALTDSGPKLDQQVRRLSDLLAAMRKPIPVQLVSDKRTQVLVYHVGDLGSFESKRLELTPGEYTVVGRCPGYRDVRRTISVKADQTSVGPITIRCEEKI